MRFSFLNLLANTFCYCRLSDDVMPTITCPASYVYTLKSSESTTIDYTGHQAIGKDNDQTSLKLTYSPPTLHVTGNDKGRHFIVRAIATDIDDNIASCQFMVLIEGMYDD